MGKVKNIIMDKAPSGSALSMVNDLGYTSGDLQLLADACNTEFGTTITANDLQPLLTVNDVELYVNSQIP